ncbi:MAG: dihydropteroate synthase [Acidobacteriaceae bacterium]|nr:dihydropteroate synthase [Acidobacteriaceae bacterium]
MSFVARQQFSWQLRTRSLSLGERTRVMAIVNLTPDSFSGDGLSGKGLDAAIAAAVAAVDAGADLIDLGAESTRPGSEPVQPHEEQRRLLPVLEGLLKQRPEAIVSIDTYHASTALEAAQCGAEIINDVSGFTWDEGMADAVLRTGCGLVLMHTYGRPSEWRTQPALGADAVLDAVIRGLSEQLGRALNAGIRRESIVLDPGFGFGKVGEENFTLLAGLDRLQSFECALLIGLSRKGFFAPVVKQLQPEGLSVPESRRIATAAANVAAVLAGAHLVRVHDVQQTREAVAVADAILAGRV